MHRTDPDVRSDELTSLSQFLDYHRATLVAKVEGLTPAQMATTVASSELTLAGLVKHLALVEDNWFVKVVAGRPEPEPWASAPWDDDRDWEFHSAVDDDPADLLALYAAACDRSRAVVAERTGPGTDGLDTLTAGELRPEGHATLRWVMLHMIEETARHNGHADLLREALDGTTGE